MSTIPSSTPTGDDFPKYVGSRSLPRIVNAFNFTARNVGKKVKYIHFSREDKAATIREDIELLCMARVLSKVVHSHSNGLPLQADADSRVYKLIFMDIGLMNAVCGLGWNRDREHERQSAGERRRHGGNSSSASISRTCLPVLSIAS